MNTRQRENFETNTAGSKGNKKGLREFPSERKSVKSKSNELYSSPIVAYCATVSVRKQLVNGKRLDPTGKSRTSRMSGIEYVRPLSEEKRV